MQRLLLFILALFFYFSSPLFADEFGDDDILEEESAQHETISDPLFYFNKGMFHLYKAIYNYGVRYVAIAYNELPLYVKNRMLNFSNNVREPSNALNHFLQLRINAGFESLFRFGVNSTVGVFGMWDVMTPLEMPKKNNDLGATFYFMGIPEGPYLVFFGPNNLRDSIGIGTTMYVERFYFPMYNDLVDYFSVSYQDSGVLRVNASTIITVVFFSDYYRQNERLLTSSFDEYTLIKDMFVHTRRQELQRIATYN
ncbi:MAG: VacJ family lipoprotein [Alphaproteobacteria bacterium]|nr:VacJ family lipoprotein [Alphaproteobacteria bacterium]